MAIIIITCFVTESGVRLMEQLKTNFPDAIILDLQLLRTQVIDLNSPINHMSPETKFFIFQNVCITIEMAILLRFVYWYFRIKTVSRFSQSKHFLL